MLRFACALGASLVSLAAAAAQDVGVDTSGYRTDCGVQVKQQGEQLLVSWPIAEKRFGRLVLDLRKGQPLIESLGLAPSASDVANDILRAVDPVTTVTVGIRDAPPGRPPEMSVFNVFFDSPAKRPFEKHLAKLDLKSVKVTSQGKRATVALDHYTAGPFAGTLEFTFYSGAPLVHVEAVMSTQQDRRAFLYDAGLVGEPGGWRQLSWYDTEGQLNRSAVDLHASDAPIAVRHRAIAAEGEKGALVCFPPPHQFFFPRDLTDNLKTVWAGRGHRGLVEKFGLGVRQTEQGGGSYVPWFNAPPGTHQRMGVFYLLDPGSAESALRETLRYTHGDKFVPLPGYRTFTSHWHMAITIAAMQAKERGETLKIPDFVRMFKEMGVNIVHLAEFHGDGHPQDPGPLRLAELDAMFAECDRLSDPELLFIPGEEANVYLGVHEPGKHPGHWLYMFPKPVRWIMRRSEGRPFAEPLPGGGTLYRVGSIDDMVKLLEREHGLAWTAHARIKASSWTPDIFKNEPFYKADSWLGAAWKAMPADLSRDRLGDRVLDLFSDMDNWGQKKHVVGEVDVFKLDHTHELYGHMNINYVKLDRVPSFDESWQPVLDVLRKGQFFVTTGEVLIDDFTVGGKASGEAIDLKRGEKAPLKATLEWTFPLKFAEVVSGDGERVYRERIDLADTAPFGKTELKLSPDLAGRKWVRFEAWDIATNGAFTQPVWIAR